MSMTNYQYQQNKNKQEQQKNEQQHSSSTTSTTSTTTTIHTDPGVSYSAPLIKMQLEQLVPLYIEVFGGRGIPQPITAYLARLIKSGMEVSVIASAINATAWARVPTPYYMRAILQRYLAEGIMTEAQLNHDMLEMQEQRQNQRSQKDEIMYFEGF